MLRYAAKALLILLLFPVFGMAAVYHIDPTVGSSGTGTAASPFKAWTNLPSMSAGDDVYFKCGTTLTPSAYLNVTWSGVNTDNPAIIGAYYMDGETAVYGVSGARPIISGGEHAVPTRATASSLITVTNRDYVEIENIHVYQSGGSGILIQGDYTNNSAHFAVRNCKVESSYNFGILINKNPECYGVIEDSEVLGSGWGWKYGDTNESTWPGSLFYANCKNANGTIRRNYVHHNWGEGIGVYRNTNYALVDPSGVGTIVEDNVIFSNRRVDIYVDSSNGVTVRRNLCIGAYLSDSTYSSINEDGKYWNQTGIWVNSEQNYPPPNNNLIYNNLVAGHYRGIGISASVLNGDLTMTGNRFYNNTSIGNKYNWFVIGDNLNQFTTTNVEFKNNVSICPSDTISNDVDRDVAWIASKFVLSNNSWHSQPSNWAGTNDVVTDVNWTKLTGWQSITSIASLSITDFMPLSNSSVISAAANLGSPYDMGISIYDTSYNLPISVTTVDRDTVGWDIGAVPYQGEAPPVTQYRYIGWSTSEGVPTTFPDNNTRYSTATGGVALTKWTATEDGTLKGIRIAPKFDWTTDYLYGAVYRDNSGTLELIASVTLPNSGTGGVWSTEYDFTSGSLSFSSGDDLYFGVPADPTASLTFWMAETRVDPAVNEVDYRYSGNLTVGATCPASITLANLDAYTPRKLGLVISYEVDTGTDEEDPVATITGPTSDATYTVTGDYRINVSGTCTDNGTVAYMTWASTDESGDCTGNLPWTTWEVNNIGVPTTGTTITVTAEDLAENTGADTLTVSFSPPANSNVIGWDDGDNPPNATPDLNGTPMAGDRISLRQPWTATEGGDIAGVYLWIGSTWDVAKCWGAIYKEVGTEYVVVGYAELENAVPGKYQFIPITSAVDGQSLRFTTGDKLLPAFAIDNAGGTGFSYGIETDPAPAEGEGMLFIDDTLEGQSSFSVADGPMDLTIADVSTAMLARDLALTLVYTDLPGDVTAPSVAITAPSGATATILSNHYPLAGTASDETELDYVVWSRSEDDEQGELTVSDGAWSTMIRLLYGDNTITTTAYDALGNSSTDTVTITFAPNVFGGSISGGFQ